MAKRNSNNPKKKPTGGKAATPVKKPVTRASSSSTAKKSNQSKPDANSASSAPLKDHAKSPARKKAKDKGTTPISPQPFPASTQMSGNQASASAAAANSAPAFEIFICASGSFCRAPWLKPLGHKCAVCKSPVHSFCYGAGGENGKTICALCVSPVGVMPSAIPPGPAPLGFREHFEAFNDDDCDDVDASVSATSDMQAEEPGENANTTNSSGNGDTGDDTADSQMEGNDDTKQSSEKPIELDKDDDNDEDMLPDSVAQSTFDLLSSSRTVASGNSDNTMQARNSDRIAVRCFVCQTVPKLEQEQDFNEMFALCFNRFLAGVIALEPLARLIKWTNTTPDISVDAVTDISSVPNEYLEYLYFSYRVERAGKKYVRVQLSIPADSCIEEILARLEGAGTWWAPWKNFARHVGSDATRPITIGWFLRSSKTHIMSRELQDSIRLVIKDPHLGLEYQRISQEPKQLVPNYRRRHLALTTETPTKNASAVHVEVQEGNHLLSMRRLERIYSGKDCPLGINLYFVREINMPKMQTRSGKGGHAKCVFHQHAFDVMLVHGRTEIHNIDGIISSRGGPHEGSSLRQALMSLKVKTVKNCIDDNLFLSINRESVDSNFFLFEFHSIVAAEAGEVVQFLPAFLSTVYKVDPRDYLSYATVKNGEGLTWDEDTRTGIDPAMSNFSALCDTLPGALREDDEGFEDMDPLTQAMYKRAAGDCDETFMSDTSRHRLALGNVKNISGRKKRHTIAFNNDDASIGSALSGSTTTSKVELATKAVEAKFGKVIEKIENERIKEKADSKQLLDNLQLQLAKSQQQMEQTNSILARYSSMFESMNIDRAAQGDSSAAASTSASAATAPPSVPARDDAPVPTVTAASDTTATHPLVEPPTTPPHGDSASTTSHSSNPLNEGEPGSGSDGAEAP